jgi:hypothetical protein
MSRSSLAAASRAQHRGVGEGRRSGERLRYTVEDAAAVLGMTTGAVRNRLSRGTPRSVKEHGTVCVLLPSDTSRDAARDIGNIPGMSSALIAEMRDLIALLERQMEGRDAILLNIAKP